MSKQQPKKPSSRKTTRSKRTTSRSRTTKSGSRSRTGSSSRSTRSGSTRSRTSRTKAPPPSPSLDERIVEFLGPYKHEIAGTILALVALALVIALASLPLFGIGPQAKQLVQQVFGWGGWLVAFSLFAISIFLFLHNSEDVTRPSIVQIIGFEFSMVAALGLTHLIVARKLADPLSIALEGKGGGLVGWAASTPLRNGFGILATGLILVVILAAGTLAAAPAGLRQLGNLLKRFSGSLSNYANVLDPEFQAKQPRLPLKDKPRKSKTRKQDTSPALSPGKITIRQAKVPTVSRKARSTALPPLDLLDAAVPLQQSESEIRNKATIIEETLLDFGLPVEVIEVRRGPSVTQYGVAPRYVEKPGRDGVIREQKVRVSQISALANDLTLALAATRIRIEAPVPGRPIVGIEVPNRENAVVPLRPVMESTAFSRIGSPLAICLGMDVSGAAVTADLASMPHLLIAGATGSGKSVCINAITTCLVCNNQPEDLRLVMIDPKMVELVRFNGLPHLLGKVEVKLERIIGVLHWLTVEMDQRYKRLAELGARNLQEYNRLAGRRKTLDKLPIIVMLLDELADLMMMAPEDVERTLVRLAQMSRAVGIHLVVATQRPSTDVVTGLIKANFPARIAFSVATSVDSRVILDSTGAETLLGRGDMLFQSPDASKPTRVQSCFVSDPEIDRVVEYWVKQRDKDVIVDESSPWDEMPVQDEATEKRDDLIDKALELAYQNTSLSTSFLQRRLRVGYPRAARLMEELEEMGVVEAVSRGSKSRRVLINDVNESNDHLDSETD
ncbi:MAG: DNA translocase FtsK 4TM domain-containing protein [Chloroflexota bacterium]